MEKLSAITQVELISGVLIFTTDSQNKYEYSWDDFTRAASGITPSNIQNIRSFVVGGSEFHYHFELKNFIVESPTGNSFALTDGLFLSLIRMNEIGVPRRFRLTFPQNCQSCQNKSK